MKKFILTLALVFASVSVTTTSSANWFGGGNNGEWKMGPNGPYWDESDWPEWTPMYWMEEFMDEFGNNNWGGGNNNFGNNFGGNRNINPYNYNIPYGNNTPNPYGYYVPNGGNNYPQAPVAPIR
ncbi:MAG TPA: hypothetical protein EYG71_07780 [Leucothrix sp.]|nr:hypothetical protein [Leucothrix sp.]